MQDAISDSNFEGFLLEAIDEGLSSLGISAKEAVYFYLDKQFQLTGQEICKRIEGFANALEKIFGSGANFLEILILEQLNEKLGKTFPLEMSEKVDFVASLEAVKHDTVDQMVER